ncbi:MAG: hypothetical protein VKN56_07575 [Cyanobacteriota bacterium]|nr:hypothetical protein [Cyanobacteriota bacterium]
MWCPPGIRNIARALLQAPKVVFTDTGLVKGDPGIRLENAVAVTLSKQAHFHGDTTGQVMGLNTIRTKDGVEVDFCLSLEDELTTLVACKLADVSPHRALVRCAAQVPEAEAVWLVRDARQVEVWGRSPSCLSRSGWRGWWLEKAVAVVPLEEAIPGAAEPAGPPEWR